MPRRPLLVLLAGVLLAAAPSARASELVTIETPSRHVDPKTAVLNEPLDRLKANVLLPDGYDGSKRFPVLFLLHGVGDTYATWSRADRGDIAGTAAGLGAIVVMPEAGKGFYANWWNEGRRGDPGWERYYLDELIPLVEERFRVLPGRGNHAIAGLSMGGLGTTYLASQRPDYFGSAATFSGFVQHQRPEIGPGLQAVGGVDYEQIFGPMNGFYATAHNPTRIVGNLEHTRVYAAIGSGLPAPGVQSEPAAIVGGGLIEAELRVQNDEFAAAARDAGLDFTYRPQAGVHDWPYWRAHLRDAIGWGLFRPVAEDPARWSYTTSAQSGRAWGYRYAFAEAPTELVRLERDGDTLRGTGSGTVTLTHAGTGCGFTAALPFSRPLPPGRCGRLTLRVRPLRARAGRTTRLRFVVTAVRDGRPASAEGARIRFGSRTVRADARGRASIRHRFRGRPGRRTATATAPGLERARARISVLPASE